MFSARSLLFSVATALVLVVTFLRVNNPEISPSFNAATINAETSDSIPQNDIYSGERPKESASSLEDEPVKVYIPPATVSGNDETLAVDPKKEEEKDPKEETSSSPSVHVPPENDNESKTKPEVTGGSESNEAGEDGITPSENGDRPLITYAYAESEFARANLRFFISHGLHDAADFIFILNGPTNVNEELIPKRDNVRVVQRDNTCFDLGAHAEVLMAKSPGEEALKDRYRWFILMNASIRGPFIPVWSKTCWSDAYLGKITDKVKLVGSTLNCHSNPALSHVQSMIWATDSIGLSHILSPEGIAKCFTTLHDAMKGEIRTTPYLRSLGYEVDVMMTSYASEKNFTFIEKHCADYSDMLYRGRYFGTNVHPFELVFMKTQRSIDDVLVDRLTEWVDGMGYSSYDVC